MTAAASSRRARDVAPPPAGFNWPMVGVITAVLMNLFMGVAAFASLRTEVATLRDELPPGTIGKLLERTEQIQNDVRELKRAARP